MSGLRRYEFSEQLADILGASRRDLHFRVTLMVTGGLVPPGPRGRGSPPATQEYAANLLLGTMAAPQQAHTVEAIRCYRTLTPTVMTHEAAAPRVVFGRPMTEPKTEERAGLALFLAQLPFGEVLTRLFDLAKARETRDTLGRELFGVWVSRGFPVAAVQLATWLEARRTVITQRYELPPGARPPAWLDPDRGGVPDPGLLHTVFLPVSKLIEIGALTTFPDKRRPHMINLGPKMAAIANLANLVQNSRYRGSWEKLLSTLASVKAWTDSVDARESRLVEIPGFGSNPGNLRMLTYVPEALAPSPALVVVLHGCTQSATSYDKGTGWSTLADRFGFAVLLPQQHWSNNPLRCFNWFRAEDTERDSGEPLSIKQMIDRMIADYGIDPGRVYVTGLSSGGAMTSVMLATYPDVFAGGAIVAGVPYRSANGLQEAFETIFQGRTRSGREWGDLVRSASLHRGPWPKISVWHGDADASVKPTNAEELIKQWADVHGLEPVPSVEKTVSGHPYRLWHGPEGEELIESYTIAGMGHGAPLEPGSEEHQCGTPAPFFNDVGISSPYHIVRFWGLRETRPDRAATARRYWQAHPMAEPAEDRAGVLPENLPTIYVDSRGRARAGEPLSAASHRSDGGTEQQRTHQADQGVDVYKIVTDSLAAVGLVQGSPDDASRARSEHSAPFGVDVQGIISKSLEAAGFGKGPEDEAQKSRASSAPFGVDVPGIIAKSLEAAGVFRDTGDMSRARTAKNSGLSGTGWEGEGWELQPHDPDAFRDGSLLFGHASSGIGCDVGHKVRTISRQLTLGHRPELNYVRRLNLNAAVNDYTSASFCVLVNGIRVDEVTAVGMEHIEVEWMQRSSIDLEQFADQTVTLTFEVTANSNVCQEVFAKAWVDRVTVRHASPVGEL
jgi:poly(hydroxyalkanoate) depolymerase family esterase